MPTPPLKNPRLVGEQDESAEPIVSQLLGETIPHRFVRVSIDKVTVNPFPRVILQFLEVPALEPLQPRGKTEGVVG